MRRDLVMGRADKSAVVQQSAHGDAGFVGLWSAAITTGYTASVAFKICRRRAVRSFRRAAGRGDADTGGPFGGESRNTSNSGNRRGACESPSTHRSTIRCPGRPRGVRDLHTISLGVTLVRGRLAAAWICAYAVCHGGCVFLTIPNSQCRVVMPSCPSAVRPFPLSSSGQTSGRGVAGT